MSMKLTTLGKKMKPNQTNRKEISSETTDAFKRKRSAILFLKLQKSMYFIYFFLKKEILFLH